MWWGDHNGLIYFGPKERVMPTNNDGFSAPDGSVDIETVP
jgi:hypothetical protein